MTLKSTSRSAIVSAFVHAMVANDSTGSLVTQVCNVANKHGADKLEKPEQDSIIGDIAKQRGWGENVIRQRSSEVRTILKSCASLPEAVEAFTRKAGACNWHGAMKLARRIVAGDSVKQAVATVFEKTDSEPKAAHPAGRVAAGLKAWYKQSKSDKRAVIVKATSLLSTIGLKLELE